MKARARRQGFLGPRSDRVLAALHVGIVGLGGGGSHVTQQLAHVGVGRYTIVDNDVIDETNLNRLVGGTAADVKRKTRKTVISARQIKRILPTAVVVQVPEIWQRGASRLIECDIIVGCLDTYGSRLELEAFCRRYLIPYLDLGMDVFENSSGFAIYGQVTLSMPGQPCLKCLRVVNEEQRAAEAARYGATGGRPQVVWPNGVLASLAVGTLMQLVTPWHSGHRASAIIEYDGNNQVVSQSAMPSYLAGCPHFESVDNVGNPWLGGNFTYLGGG